jgi:hypothetical protein
MHRVHTLHMLHLGAPTGTHWTLTLRCRIADTPGVKILYVETCPDCRCPMLRSESGERGTSSRLRVGCTGCECHVALGLAAGS